MVISNCVINLAADKHAVLRESARVLRSGADSPSPTSSPTQTWTRKPDPTCSNGPVVSPAPHPRGFVEALAAAGFVDIDINETHRVHTHAGSAIIRARMP